MYYAEMTIDEARKRCDKNTKVLVAIQNLESSDEDIIFVKKNRCEYNELFENIKTGYIKGIDGESYITSKYLDLNNLRNKKLCFILRIKEILKIFLV